MSMKKLPSNVHSLLSGSHQINNNLKAVEELVYNSLDAGATSIAVRINIEDNIIQVIDNGCGISRPDFKYIGHNYTTSKFVDLATLRSAPNTYGFRGQYLANLIKVSKNVNITSRQESSECTWMKQFEYGKEKQIIKCDLRPSKGTTVEVKGLFHNLSIQKKSIGMLNEHQNIKYFLEHLSLVHVNISLSLRDDLKNEITFKIPKNRDIYQTLSILYNIRKEDLQELQVEKSTYKVKAFLGNSDKGNGRNYIFLNGKFLPNLSKLHRIVDKNLNKCESVRDMKKVKTKTSKIEEADMFHSTFPFYLMFITCPHLDYDLRETSKQSFLEFKDWSQVTKLLSKLVIFYNGDGSLKEINRTEANKVTSKEDIDTREQVKKIMEKILGCPSKKPQVSHMEKGIKGKQIKRKTKKKSNKKSVLHVTGEDTTNKNLKSIKNIEAPNKRISIESLVKKVCDNNINEVNDSPKPNTLRAMKSIRENKCPANKQSQVDKVHHTKLRKRSKLRHIEIKQQNKCLKKYNRYINKLRINKDIQRKYKIQTDIAEARHHKSRKQAKANEKLRKQKKYQKKREVYANEAGPFNNIVGKVDAKNSNDNNDVVIHEYMPRPKKSHVPINNTIYNIQDKGFKSNYDLLQTILNSQKENNIPRQVDATKYSAQVMTQKRPKKPETNKRTVMQSDNTIGTMITFQSHNFYCDKRVYVDNYKQNTSYPNQLIDDNDAQNFNKKRRTFITKQSIDNFLLRSNCHENVFKKKYKSGFTKQLKTNIKRLFRQTTELFQLKNQIMGKTSDSSYTIEFTESYNKVAANEVSRNVSKAIPLHNDVIDIEETMTGFVRNENNASFKLNIDTEPNINLKRGYTLNENSWSNETFTINKNDEVTNKSTPNNIPEDQNMNFIFISESEKQKDVEIFDPINVCETVMQTDDVINNEFQYSFNKSMNNNNNLCINENSNHNNSGLIIKDNDANECIIEDEHIVPNNKNICNEEVLEKVSHHFTIFNNVETADFLKQSPAVKSKLENKITLNSNSNIIDVSVFNLQNRLGFVPKGMSQIFVNPNLKITHAYNASKDYYEDDMYNNFVDEVRNYVEIFEPKIQGAKDLTTKAIEKVNVKINKDNSALKFDGQSLKYAQVLQQIDEKFIPAIIRESSNKEKMLNYLVLFDQHAVHERIRLENNLNDYFSENQWKQVAVDNLTVKLSKDEILYLHNYRNKFTQLGLKWSLLNNNEVSITSIPEAILGKNPREVDKVIRAVKNLIVEEINIIKMQGGCVSMYPKSIMDLVFSEACRYAIKFGDKLSTNDCEQLLKMLSECKTPFQCAHGRPVMAAIMEVTPSTFEYTVNINKLLEFKGRK